MYRALIVDDSRTARYALQRLLERAGFQVDAVDSGEASLDYLRLGGAPDLIFMDHMMPGMDGFAAVKAIKADSATAAIPIIMYTSREGEVYVGQARALGAVDVLGKPARTLDLQRVLERLHERDLLPTEPAPEAEPVVADDEPLLRPEPAAGARAPREMAPLESAAPPARRALLWFALAVLPLLWVTALYIPAEHEHRELREREEALYRLVQVALDPGEPYPFGELPLAGERLERLRELVAHLHAAGFRGRVRVESHAGEFCLVPAAQGAGRWALPTPGASLAECAAIGLPTREARTMTEQQSPAFQRFLETSPLLVDGRIRVETVGYGVDRPAHAYPLDGVVGTAGAWNAVAARNQRVRFVLLPDARDRRAPFWRRLAGF